MKVISSDQQMIVQFTSQAKISLARQVSTRETTPTQTAASAPHQSVTIT
jgi:hypothetical protein